MAHMWTKSAAGWEARKLDPKLYDLDSLSIAQAGESIAGGRRAPGTRRLLAAVGGTRTWVLAASPDAEIRVNGRTLLAGLSVLCDRDEIRVGTGVRVLLLVGGPCKHRRVSGPGTDLTPLRPLPSADQSGARRRCAVRSVTSGTTSRPKSRAGPIPTNAPIAVIPHLLRPVFRGFPRSK